MAMRAFQQIEPCCGVGVYIDEAATVIGAVNLGDDVSIWPGAVLRGDVNNITVGARSNIQDNSVCHVTHQYAELPEGYPLIIGEDVTVGHAAVLHGCTIGDRCLIGIGVIILDGVMVEPEVMIAAGALVPPGKVLMSGYLYVGSPAKAVRPLTDKERAHFTYSANHYLKLKNEYL